MDHADPCIIFDPYIIFTIVCSLPSRTVWSLEILNSS